MEWFSIVPTRTEFVVRLKHLMAGLLIGTFANHLTKLTWLHISLNATQYELYVSETKTSVILGSHISLQLLPF